MTAGKSAAPTLNHGSAARASGHSRLMQLDVLRGAAILLVLCRHGIVSSERAGWLKSLSFHLWHLGWTGVDLFFVLSGLLVGGLLFKEIRVSGRLNAKRFLVRRGFKIWPAYFVFLAFVFVRESRIKTHTVKGTLRALLPNLVHLQNYLGTPRPITWSLAVEEHFYLLLPLLLLLLLWAGRRGGNWLRAVPVVAVGLILLCTSLRVALNWHGPFEMFKYLTPTHLRIDGLFFGVMIAYLYHMHPNYLSRVGEQRAALLLIGLALVLPMMFVDQVDAPWVWTLGLTMLYLGYGCILVAFVYATPASGKLGRLLATRPAAAIAAVGVFSYSIYLWHYDLGLLVVHNHVLPHLPFRNSPTLYWLIATFIYFLMAIAAGVVMSKLVEMPALYLRERLYPSAAGNSARAVGGAGGRAEPPVEVAGTAIPGERG